MRREVHTIEYDGISYGDFCQRPKIAASVTVLTAKLGRTPTDTEVAGYAGLTVTLVARSRHARTLPIPMGSTTGGAHYVRFDTPGDMVAPSTKDITGVLRAATDSLSALELVVAVRRSGIDGKQTLNELAATLELGREVLRRRYHDAMDVITATVGP